MNNLKNKFGESIIEINKSYTSKNDSTAKGEICKHEKYLRQHIRRITKMQKGK